MLDKTPSGKEAVDGAEQNSPLRSHLDHMITDDVENFVAAVYILEVRYIELQDKSKRAQDAAQEKYDQENMQHFQNFHAERTKLPHNEYSFASSPSNGLNLVYALSTTGCKISFKKGCIYHKKKGYSMKNSLGHNFTKPFYIYELANKKSRDNSYTIVQWMLNEFENFVLPICGENE